MDLEAPREGGLHMQSSAGVTDCLARAIQKEYENGQTDYSMHPLVVVDKANQPAGVIADGDSVIFCCKRGERETQLTDSFVDPQFGYFERKRLRDLYFATFTLYHNKYSSWNIPVAFKPEMTEGTLGEVIAKEGLRQLRIAESEKFAHVTFFFNGETNSAFCGEERISIDSPKNVPFDSVPALSLPQVSSRLIQEIESEKYHFVVTNFANGDIIGHTSNFDAKVACAREVDRRLQEVTQHALSKGYTVCVTADHGVLETGFKDNGNPNVSHTKALVPFIIVDPHVKGSTLKNGRLSNIAATILDMMGIAKPDNYNESLFVSKPAFRNNRILLIILDGWGIGKQDGRNPIYTAHTAFFDSLMRDYPVATLLASEENVGLLPGKAGNSEAGHMNIGAGRVVPQDDVIIQQSIESGSFFQNQVLVRAIDRLKEAGGNLHLIGLLSHKSSHGTMDYMLNVLDIARARGTERAFLHVILDGRSTDPGSAPDLVRELGASLDHIGIGQIASIVGRGIALDRDHNYIGKTKLAYDAMVHGTGTFIRCVQSKTE